MNNQIAIIGLDRVGLSLGLALKKNHSPADYIGFDLDPAHMKTALSLKAVDKTVSNIHSAVEKADIVFLNSLPVDVTEWMADICRSLKEGAILINMAPVHSRVCMWVEEHFPEKRSFLNATLSLNGSYLDNEENSDELFNSGIMIISTIPGTDARVVQQVLDLAAEIGASPMFSDPVEADGLISQTNLFPRLISLLYLQGITGQSGWLDAQKVTGPVFWQLSKLLYEIPSSESASYEIFTHKENVLHLLDMMRDQIDQFQDSIQKENEDSLKVSIQKILDDHNQWMTRRKNGNWDARGLQSEIKPEGIWKKLLGVGTQKKKR
jgi:prephenate dehydrogenase